MGVGFMATSTESNPPVKESASNPPVKESKSLSSLNEFNLEKSILRRGLATQAEIDLAKAYKAKLASKGEDARGLLEIMVEAKLLTKTQSARLIKEAGECSKKLEIPGYQILERLGKGSMGVVYKARQTSVDRIVAVKILLDALAKNKEFIKRFDREAKIAAKLAHNNIVNAIDAGQVEGIHYFVMEYVEGKTIKDDLDQGKVFDEKVALKIVMATAEALQHAHHRGLIHRDIKPENVILTRDGLVKLADLGLARLTADEKWSMSEAGMAIGTPYYISPEQVRGQVDVDIRADIYSLGATLYHMVTGRVPYDGETPTEVMRKHVDKTTVLTPPDHLNTKLSSGLGMVVETMMAKNRENRYRSPDDLILDLKCLLAGDPPMIAGQKIDSLASLAEGDAEAGYQTGGATESQLVEMAGYVNSRGSLIAALAMLLALSVVTNVVFLATR
jgi:serine/threonine protein kinase